MTTPSSRSLLILGCGYVGTRLALNCIQHGFGVLALTRSNETAEKLKNLGIPSIQANQPDRLDSSQLTDITHLVDSIPLSKDGSEPQAPQRQWLSKTISHLPNLRWAGYLSSTSVYGDANGDWVDESYPCKPTSGRGKARLQAEQHWLQSFEHAEIFRLAGIYGPERHILPSLQQGNYRTIDWQPPHYSSRIHVDDIVGALMTAMDSPDAGRILNLADDLPLPNIDYARELSQAFGFPEPIVLSPEQAHRELPASSLSFFQDNKRIDNHRLKELLSYSLKYPSFREGFQAIRQIID